MRKSGIHVLQAEKTDRGALKINVESALRTVPVENATVDISIPGSRIRFWKRYTRIKMAIQVRWN